MSEQLLQEILNEMKAVKNDRPESLRKHLDERLDTIALDINYLVRKTAQQESAIQELRRAK